MKKTIALAAALYVALLCTPYYAAAQGYPAPAGDIFRQEGIASWYGPEFDGRPTASGEIFNSTMLTAAHPSLPFGTLLIVTNRHNNRQVTVRVNDRGPFVAGRIIDVSKAAAEQLDMLVTGTAPVLIQSAQAGVQPQTQSQSQTNPQVQIYNRTIAPPQQAYSPPPAPPVQQPPQQPQQPQIIVTPAPETPPQGPYAPITVTVYPPPAQGAPSPYTPIPADLPQAAAAGPINLPPPVSGARLIPAIDPSPLKSYKLQVGSFKVARNAVDTYEKLRRAGLNPAYEQSGEYYRIVLSGIRGTEVRSVADKLQAAGFNEALIREE